MKLQISLVASLNLPYHFCLALLQCEHPQKLQNRHIPTNYKTIYRWHSSNFQARLIVFHGCNFCLCCFLWGNMFHQFLSTIYKKTNVFERQVTFLLHLLLIMVLPLLFTNTKWKTKSINGRGYISSCWEWLLLLLPKKIRCLSWFFFCKLGIKENYAYSLVAN